MYFLQDKTLEWFVWPLHPAAVLEEGLFVAETRIQEKLFLNSETLAISIHPNQVIVQLSTPPPPPTSSNASTPPLTLLKTPHDSLDLLLRSFYTQEWKSIFYFNTTWPRINVVFHCTEIRPDIETMFNTTDGERKCSSCVTEKLMVKDNLVHVIDFMFIAGQYKRKKNKFISCCVKLTGESPLVVFVSIEAPFFWQGITAVTNNTWPIAFKRVR